MSDGFDQPALTLEENLARLASVPLLRPPGEASAPSLASDVLGAVLQRAGDAPLSDIVARTVTRPLGMADTGFVVADPARLAQAYLSVAGRARASASPDALPTGAGGVLHVDPRRALAATAYASGGAGMAGTADDYGRLLETLRTGSGAVLKPDSARLLAAALAGSGAQPRPGPTAGPISGGGAWGTRSWVDPAAGLSVVLLTNTAPEQGQDSLPARLAAAIWAG